MPSETARKLFRASGAVIGIETAIYLTHEFIYSDLMRQISQTSDGNTDYGLFFVAPVAVASTCLTLLPLIGHKIASALENLLAPREYDLQSK